MHDATPEATIEKIRQQFDRAPYPRVPLEQSPKQNYNVLFMHSLATPYYLKYQQAIDPTDRLILDAGCGSGYTTLKLAEANPGARIVGIDLSEASVELSRQRLKYHGFDNVEFHALSVYDLPQLGMTFDYINGDEMLYLLPDPTAGLQVMRSVLNPRGIIRANLHNAYQRSGYFRAQELFKLLGLMDENPDESTVEVVVETMRSLKDNVTLKMQSWKPQYEKPESEESLMANHLLQGDKGFTIPDLFAMLHAADLELISMVDWRHWEVTDLFKDAEDLPAFIGMSLMGASLEERLRLYELLHPVHRLMDFWCAPAGDAVERIPVEDWSNADWETAIVHLHPQLRAEPIREALLDCVENTKLFNISRFISLPTLGPIFIDSLMAACLLPLWDAAQPFPALVDRYLKLKPLHPVTLEPVNRSAAAQTVKELLNQLEAFLYVLPVRRGSDPS